MSGSLRASCHFLFGFSKARHFSFERLSLHGNMPLIKTSDTVAESARYRQSFISMRSFVSIRLKQRQRGVSEASAGERAARESFLVPSSSE